jgi:hypothetical protein
MLFLNKKNALAISIISFFLSMFIYIFIQIQSNNLHTNILKNTSPYAIAGVLLLIIMLNIMIYRLSNNYIIFLCTIILEFLVLYTFCLFNITHPGLLYFPVVMLILVSIYQSNMLFNTYLAGYLFCTSIFIISVIFSASHNLTLLNLVRHSFLNNMLLSLILIMIISILYYSKKPKLRSKKTLNLIPHQVARALNNITNNINNSHKSFVTTVPADVHYNPAIVGVPVYTDCNPTLQDTAILANICYNSTVIDTDDSLSNTTENDFNNTYVSIVKTNIKSAYTLSSDIKNTLTDINNLNNNIVSHTSNAKNELLNTNDYINSLHRNTFNISASHKNMQSDLDDAYESVNQLKNILIELDNLSVMTTHLSNKATLEKTHTPPSPEVMNFIIKEFHSYSDEIRQSILKMSAIFNTLDKKYYSCNKEIKCSADLMATYSNTLNKLSTSLNQVNEDFNSILKTDNNLKTSIESSRINAKRLVADISELRASMSYIVGNTYSTQKKKSVY